MNVNKHYVASLKTNRRQKKNIRTKVQANKTATFTVFKQRYL